MCMYGQGTPLVVPCPPLWLFVCKLFIFVCVFVSLLVCKVLNLFVCLFVYHHHHVVNVWTGNASGGPVSSTLTQIPGTNRFAENNIKQISQMTQSRFPTNKKSVFINKEISGRPVSTSNLSCGKIRMNLLFDRFFFVPDGVCMFS